jgi:hypothetical protein
MMAITNHKCKYTGKIEQIEMIEARQKQRYIPMFIYLEEEGTSHY